MNSQMKEEFKKMMIPEYEKQQRNGRIWGGLILVAVGVAFLLRTLNYDLPYWLFSWPMILILVGIYNLGKHGFTRPFGMIPLAIGLVFLVEKTTPGLEIVKIALPALAIVFGVWMLMFPSKKKGFRHMRHMRNAYHTGTSTESSSEDQLFVDTVFGGIDRNVISKDFKGGRVNCVFGGAEINLLNADIQGTVVLEVTAVFGGIDLTVPAKWKVQTEITAILGGVEDKRAMNEESLNTDKVLILKGEAIFGGIEIKGY